MQTRTVSSSFMNLARMTCNHQNKINKQTNKKQQQQTKTKTKTKTPGWCNI